MRAWWLMLAVLAIGCTSAVGPDDADRQDDEKTEAADDARAREKETEALRPTGISTTPTGPREGISTSP